MFDTPSAVATATGADALVRALAEHGVEVIFMNPGTDTAPVQEAVRRARESARPSPDIVLCPHEGIALAAAHAYHAVTGRVQATMVHVDVGTQNLGSMLHNAARAEAGVLILAGRTPLDESGEEAGGRSRTVHWMQDVPDQHAIVRQYVKATFDAESARQVAPKARRALSIAQATPPGPVYLTLAREVLMEPAPSDAAAPAVAVPIPPAPSADAIRRSVDLIEASRHPVVVTTRIGRDPGAVALLIEFAERIGARVVDQRDRMNFPSDHPLLAATAEQAAQAWREADLVVVLDSPVPWVPKSGGPSVDCPVILVDTDPIHASMPSWGFPSELSVTSTARHWLEAVLPRIADRQAAGAARSPRPSAKPVAHADDRLTATAFLEALRAHVRADDIVIDEASTNSAAVAQHLPRTLPATLFRAGGSGLGWSLGALLGIGLARPEARSVAVVGDGGFLFGTPLAAFVAMQRAGVGGLVVVLQNGGYAASSRPVHELFPERGPEAGQPLATAFDAPLDVALVAQSCGAVGVTIRHPEELSAGVETAAAAWRAGRLVALGVHVASPWIGDHDAR